MAIILGSTTLSPSMQWEDRSKYNRMAASAKRTIGGGIRVYTQRLYNGFPVSLVAREDTGWITGSMLSSLHSMADVEGQQYTLVFHQDTYTVVFFPISGVVIDMVPLTPKSQPSDSDFYIGSINLLIV